MHKTTGEKFAKIPAPFWRKLDAFGVSFYKIFNSGPLYYAGGSSFGGDVKTVHSYF